MPAPLALAVIVAILDLIPLIGATIGAFIVALVTLFTDFPTVTIIWVIFAIAYQQFENYVIQPRIQSRAVQLDPFVIVDRGDLRRHAARHDRRPACDSGRSGAARSAVHEFMLYRRGDSTRWAPI